MDHLRRSQWSKSASNPRALWGRALPLPSLVILLLSLISHGQVSPLSPHNHSFPGGSDGKASAYNTGDQGLIPGQKVPLEKGMATHSSILAWETTWAEEPGELQTRPSHWYTPPTAKFSPTVSRKVFQILVCSASNPARVVKQVQIESINSGIETLWLYRRLSELPECYTHLQTTEYKNTLPGSKWMMWQG